MPERIVVFRWGWGRLGNDEYQETAKRVGFYIPLNSHVWMEGDEMTAFWKNRSSWSYQSRSP
jgi:hypothetical protein